MGSEQWSRFTLKPKEMVQLRRDLWPREIQLRLRESYLFTNLLVYWPAMMTLAMFGIKQKKKAMAPMEFFGILNQNHMFIHHD